MRKNKIIVLCLILGLSLIAMPAFAGIWTAGASNVSVLIGANSAMLYAAQSGGTAPAYTITEGEGGALAAGGFVTLKLTGGAVFTATAMAAPVIASAPGASLAVADGGTAGYNYVKYVVVGSGIASGATITFNTTTANCLNVYGVTNNANVDVNVSIINSSNVPYTTEKSFYADRNVYLFTGVNLFAIANNNNAVLTDTADVLATTGPFTKFINNTLVGQQLTFSTTTPIIGAGLTIPTVKINKKKILVTLAGDFGGISKVTCTNYTGSDSTGTPTGTVGQFSIAADKQHAYAVYNLDYLGGGTAAPLVLNPKFYIDGTTTQIKRSFTCQFENLEDAPTWVATVWQAAQTNYKIDRNGMSFTANSLGPLNTIKISDKSGNVSAGGGKVIITAYDVNGTKLSEVAGAPALLIQNYETLQLTGDVMAARFTGTPMMYEVAVASTNAIVTNVKKTAEGFGSTVYTNSDGGV